MRKLRLGAWICLVAILLNSTGVFAQTLFKKELQAHYGVKSVSCNTCHVSGKPKKMRNDFGELFAKGLAGKNVTKRIKESKSDPDLKAKVEAEVKKEFGEVMKKIDKMKYPGGGTYGEAIKAGKIAGVKLE